MSEWQQPVPQRIGDAERDKAAEFLREHHAQGRLDAAEFDERITAALSAKWQSDLDRLFIDLPAPTPQSVQPTSPAVTRPRADQPGMLTSGFRQTMDMLTMAIWPIAIVGMVVFHGKAVILIIAAIMLTSMWHRRKQQDTAARRRLERQQLAERQRLEEQRRRFGEGGGPWGPQS